MNSLFLDICAEDYADGEVTAFVDRYNNYTQSINTFNLNPSQTTPIYCKNTEFSVPYASAATQSAIYISGTKINGIAPVVEPTNQKLTSVYTTPDLWISAVVRMPEVNKLSSMAVSRVAFNRSITPQSIRQFIWGSCPFKTPDYIFTDPLQCVLMLDSANTEKGTIIQGGLHTNKVDFLYKEKEVYIIAISTWVDSILVFNKIEISSRFGTYKSSAASTRNTNFNEINYPGFLSFLSIGQAASSQFLGYIKRCGIYPYSKIQEFKKLYLGE